MRLSLVVLFTASLASALSVFRRQDAPACAASCWQTTDGAPCEKTDTACLCVNVNFLTELYTCAESGCTEPELETAATALLAQCKAAGIDLENPIPACALTCVTNTPVGSCTEDDDTCLCNDTTYIQTAASCFQSSCTGEDLTTAQTVGKALCRAAGVDISPIVGA